jgi:hypothetical protein
MVIGVECRWDEDAYGEILQRFIPQNMPELFQGCEKIEIIRIENAPPSTQTG